MNCSPPGSSVHGDSPSKNTGVGCHALLQRIFLTQGSNSHLMSLAVASMFFTTSTTWEAWRAVWSFLEKLKIELPYNPEITLLGIYPEKTIIQKAACTLMFIAALFTIAGTWKQPRCPSTEEWIKKMRYVYTMEYYSAIQRNEIVPFAETQQT